MTEAMRRGWIVLLLCLCAPRLPAEGLEQALQLVESVQMARLARLQQRLPLPVRPFASDGCSGGMSAGWSVFARGLPGARERFGEKPPWEPCCVAHDRAYWQGRGEDGYRRRLAADRALRRCVLDTARQQGDEWAARLGLSADELQRLMQQVAEAMYLAVRLGGGPCTGLPWRWGHGWPPCGEVDDDQRMTDGRMPSPEEQT